MSDFIFKTETINKGMFYTRIKEILVEAGWQNISSRPSTEFDVFYSEGETGDKGLYFQMKEQDSSSSTALSSSAYSILYFRLIKGYTPNQTLGVAGTFDRGTSETWKGVRLNYTNNLTANHPMIINYHCNLNRLIVFVTYPTSMDSFTYSTYFTIGFQDGTFGKLNPKQDLILAANYFDYNIGTGNILITDQADNPRTTSYPLSTYDLGDIKSVSLNNTLFFSEVAYGSTTEGIRGILDGVYTLRDSSTNIWLSKIKQGDEFIDEEGKRYKIISTHASTYYSSFSTRFLAFRIE